MNNNAIAVAKLNILDAHDRLIHVKKNFSNTLSQGAEDCLKKNPLSLALQERSPYIYLFAHPRTEPDGNMKKMFWQPRLIRPQAQSNSYLFRAQSKSDIIEICWMIPAAETWGQAKKGMVGENAIVEWSIIQYKTNKVDLEKAHPEDMTEEMAKNIYMDVVRNMEKKKLKLPL